MAEFDKALVKATLNKAKGGKEIFYAFGLGAKPEECQFLIHKSKTGRKLGAELKAQKEIKKVGFGTVAYDGSVVTFAPEKPVKNMVRLLRKLFRANGLALKLQLADGSEGEEGEEELELAEGGAEEEEMLQASAGGAAEGGEAGAAGPEQAERQKWVKRMAGLEREIDEMLAEIG